MPPPPDKATSIVLCDILEGGVNVSNAATGVEYRTELREVKAHAELCQHRAVVDELGFSPVLVNYAIECQLKETGTLNQLIFLPKNIADTSKNSRNNFCRTIILPPYG